MPLNRDDDYPNHSKRYRPEADNEEEVGASTFAQELMMVASDETSDADDDDDGGDDSTWSRPALPPVNAANDKILFQLFHLDFYEGDRLLEMPGPERSPVPIIRIYGATESGNSVVAHVHGFAPYFYASAPPSLTPEHLEKFRRALNLALHRELREDGTRGLQYLVVAVALEEKESKQANGFNGTVRNVLAAQVGLLWFGCTLELLYRRLRWKIDTTVYWMFCRTLRSVEVIVHRF